MSNKVTYEIYWLRFVACLSVVLIHAISSGLYFFDFNASPFEENTLLLLQLFIMFATPSFVFMSEFILSKYYPDGLPNGFFKKRIKYLLIPYLSMAFVYAIIFVDNHDFKSVIVLTARHALLGDFVAYFVLIIFQFYILHFLFHNKLSNWNPIKVILISFLINAFYLGFFVITKSPTPDGLIRYFWGKGHWVLFPAWLLYFSLGYYAGRQYNRLLKLLNKYKTVVYATPLITYALLIFMTNLGFSITSKRIDIIFHTVAIIFLVLLVASKLNKPPKFVLFISEYSFGIYLLHKLVVDTIGPITNNIIIHVFSLFIFGVVFSVTIMFIFNHIPYGKYITGQINRTKKDYPKPLKTGA